MEWRRLSAIAAAGALAAGAAFASGLRPVDATDLAQNGGFEISGQGELPKGWATSKKRVREVQFAWSAERPHSGKRCIGIVSSHAEKTPWFWWEQKIDGLQQGETYRLAAWVRGEGTPAGSQLGMKFLDASGTAIQTPVIKGVHEVGADWKEVSQAVAAPPGTAAGLIRLAMHGQGAVWLDDVRLERGSGPATQSFKDARVYPVLEAEEPIAIDGRADDWTGAQRAEVRTTAEVSYAEAEVMDRQLSKGERDLSFSFALSHDARNLYLMISVRDDVFRPSVPYWEGDSAQFAIDTNYGRSPSGYGPGDYALGVALTKDHAQTVIDHAPPGARLAVEDVQLGFTRAEDGYAIELGIPWSALEIEAPKHNQRLGFSIVVNDSDGGGRKWAEWTPGIVKSKRPADFGTLILMRETGMGLSLEGPAEAVSDAAPLDLTAWLVSMGDKTETVPLTLTLDEGGEGKTVRREAPASRGATQVVFAFEPGWAAAGKHRATVSAGLLSSDCPFEILPVRAMVAETEKRMAKLKERIAVLAKLAAQGREAKVDVACADVTLATAELFQKWIEADLKRIGSEALARQEAERLEPLVERAIAEAEEAVANPKARPAVPAPDAMKARMRDGGWYVGDRPIFLIGFSQDDPDCLEMLPRLGCNLTNAHPGGPDQVFARGPEPNLKRIDLAVEDIRRAASLGLRSDIFTKQEMPRWLVARFPDVRAAEGHFMPYDIDHPEAVRLTCELLEAVGRQTAGEPGTLCYQLWNEANYERLSKRGLAKFQQDMRQRYGSIEGLNEAWGTNYADFDKVKPVQRDPQQAAAYMDWCRWNDARVTGFIVAMREALRRGNPQAVAHVKIPNELGLEGSRTKNNQTQTISEHWKGIDRWALARALDIHGSDTRPTMLSEKYSIAFPYPEMAFDLQRSMDPSKPIFDSEWHGIQTVYYQNGDIPGVFLNAALWLSYLHGMDANMTWSWSRKGTEPKAEKSKGSPFYGSLMSQPQLLDAFGRNSVAVQRLAREIVAFTNSPMRARLLFSKPSAILDLNHLDTLAAAYETLAWLDAPVGFVLEEMLLDGFSDCDLLIVPAARHASPGVREAIAALAAKGVRVIAIGEDCLSLTPQGKPMDNPASLGPEILTSAADSAAFDAAIEKAGIRRLARCVGPDGSTSKPVEFRSVEIGGRRLGYIIGLGKEPATVRIEIDGRPASWRSLLTAERGSETFTVKPWDMDLFEFEPQG